MGPAKFTIDELDDATLVIAVAGELDMSNVSQLGRHIDQARADGKTSIVVDLDELRHMDSSGLAHLMRAHLNLSEEGSRLAIVAGSEPLRRTFQIRGVDELLTIAASRDEALAAMKQSG
jgi:anti-sigma B factor antagonist